MDHYREINSKEENPTKSGWYNTDKGWLYWFNESKEWSCRDDRVSEEFPKVWYKESKQSPTEGFQLFLNEIAEWSTKTFPNQTSTSKLHHLKKEVGELIEAIEENHEREEVEKEYADCFMLLFDSARIEGLTLIDIINVMKRKFDINKQRIWGEPDENGVIHHIEEEKEYECTNCKTISKKKDNRLITVGYCDKCGHPLWNNSEEGLARLKEFLKKIIKESVASRI